MENTIVYSLVDAVDIRLPVSMLTMSQSHTGSIEKEWGA